MENKLKMLFEYQRFENNSKLARIIERSEAAYPEALSEDELLLVTAARSDVSDETVATAMELLRQMELYPDEDLVRGLLGSGKGALRDWALQKSGGDPRADLIMNL